MAQPPMSPALVAMVARKTGSYKKRTGSDPFRIGCDTR
jgi:hypothetical protein